MGLPRVTLKLSRWMVALGSTQKQKDSLLLPDMTASPEPLFSHSEHNSFILTALRRGHVRTNLHLSSSGSDTPTWLWESAFASTVSDLASLSLPPQRSGKQSHFSFVFLSLHLSLAAPLVVLSPLLSAFWCTSSADTQEQPSGKHLCIAQPEACVGMSGVLACSEWWKYC